MQLQTISHYKILSGGDAMLKRKFLIIVSITIVVALMLVSSAQSSIGLPDYDSGWVSINQGQTLTLTHDLETTDVLVYVTSNRTNGITQIYYGGEIYWSESPAQNNYAGLYWHSLDNTSIAISRYSNDLWWSQVRVMIWKIEQEPQGVGGLTIPVDKFSLLAPYIALASTITLAVSISAAYVKHRKKQ
jgi:hypothetical protein